MLDIFLVADIDENTAIEYIEEDNNTLTTNDKTEVNNLSATPAKSSKSQRAESEVIVLDDNDSASLMATATLASASPATLDEATEDTVVVECKPSKMVSGNTPTTINVATLKPTTVTTVNRNDLSGLQ